MFCRPPTKSRMILGGGGVNTNPKVNIFAMDNLTITTQAQCNRGHARTQFPLAQKEDRVEKQSAEEMNLD